MYNFLLELNCCRRLPTRWISCREIEGCLFPMIPNRWRLNSPLVQKTITPTCHAHHRTRASKSWKNQNAMTTRARIMPSFIRLRTNTMGRNARFEKNSCCLSKNICHNNNWEQSPLRWVKYYHVELQKKSSDIRKQAYTSSVSARQSTKSSISMQSCHQRAQCYHCGSRDVINSLGSENRVARF